jgi:hypothetical protein
MAGTIDTVSGQANIAGTNPGGSALSLNAVMTGIPDDENSVQWSNQRSKSAVYFTHKEKCSATVTINGETFSGLNSHYSPGGFCASEYDLWVQLAQDVDDKASKLFCHSGTIQGLDGNPKDFTDCNTLIFILDKNKEYTYTVTWENGKTETGKFTSPAGGYKKAICLSKIGQDCEDTGNGTGTGTNSATFSFSGSSHIASAVNCMATPNYYAMSTVAGSSTTCIIYIYGSAEPAAGTYTLIEDPNSLQPGQASVVFNGPNAFFTSASGTLSLTKVGGKLKATFSGIPMTNLVGTASTTGSGSITCN